MKSTLTARVLFVTAALIFASGICHARSTHETIDHVQPRMVKIFGAGGLRGLAGYGTGFLVSKEGHIVTIWSHVLDPDEVVVVLKDGRRYFAKVLGADPQLDLAVLQIQAPEEALDLPFFDVASESGEASAGTRVLGFSNMFKVATGDESVSVLHGVIAARTALRTRRGTFETPYNGEVYVVDAITNNSGAGGGLLTSRDGMLLGVIGRELRNADTNTWVNYSIPMSALQQAITEIINGDTRINRRSTTLCSAGLRNRHGSGRPVPHTRLHRFGRRQVASERSRTKARRPGPVRGQRADAVHPPDEAGPRKTAGRRPPENRGPPRRGTADDRVASSPKANSRVTTRHHGFEARDLIDTARAAAW